MLVLRQVMDRSSAGRGRVLRAAVATAVASVAAIAAFTIGAGVTASLLAAVPIGVVCGAVTAVFLLGAIAIVARRAVRDGEAPAVWLAILILATLRSPFLPQFFRRWRPSPWPSSRCGGRTP